MIRLPEQPRRGMLQSFSLVMGGAAGLLVGASSAWLGSAFWFWGGAGLAIALAVPGLIRPQTAVPPYRVWRTLTRGYLRVARTLLQGIHFYVVVTMVSLAGKKLALRPPREDESMWSPRGTLPDHCYLLPYASQQERSVVAPWIFQYSRWARDSGNFWLIFLLPFLVLLSLHYGDEAQTSAPNIYTLF